MPNSILARLVSLETYSRRLQSTNSESWWRCGWRFCRRYLSFQSCLWWRDTLWHSRALLRLLHNMATCWRPASEMLGRPQTFRKLATKLVVGRLARTSGANRWKSDMAREHFSWRFICRHFWRHPSSSVVVQVHQHHFGTIPGEDTLFQCAEHRMEL